jgi:hypothetical protein
VEIKEDDGKTNLYKYAKIMYKYKNRRGYPQKLSIGGKLCKHFPLYKRK